MPKRTATKVKVFVYRGCVEAVYSTDRTIDVDVLNKDGDYESEASAEEKKIEQGGTKWSCVWGG